MQKQLEIAQDKSRLMEQYQDEMRESMEKQRDKVENELRAKKIKARDWKGKYNQIVN